MQTHHYYSTILFAVATLSGCASVPDNSLLNEARDDYNTAQNNPQITALAPNELKQAGNAMQQANEASSKNEDGAVVNHLAYLTKQRVAIAEETAIQKTAEMTVTAATAERSRIRLDARTLEADKANQDAAASLQQSEMSQQQARDAEMRASELETQLKDLNAQQTERGLVITLGDVLFDTNQAQLKSGSNDKLAKLAIFMKKYPQRTARVEGYTDSTGSAEHNQELSGRRADSVRTSLLDMGISGDRITTQAYGEESPVGDNATAAGRQLNRRVEIILPDDDSNASLD